MLDFKANTYTWNACPDRYQWVVVVVVIYFQQISNAHILTKYNACNIIRWWLSGKCKAHIADNQLKGVYRQFSVIRTYETYVIDKNRA